VYELRTYGFRFVYVIVVIWDINHGFMMLVDHFKSIQGGMDVYMNWALSRVSLIYICVVRF